MKIVVGYLLVFPGAQKDFRESEMMHGCTCSPFITTGVHFIFNTTNYLYPPSALCLWEFFYFSKAILIYQYYHCRGYFSNTYSIIKKNLKFGHCK